MANKRGSSARPTTVYLDEKIKRAAMMRGVVTGRSLSSQVNDALLKALQVDESDLRLFKEREKEPGQDYEEFLAEMKRDGRL